MERFIPQDGDTFYYIDIRSYDYDCICTGYKISAESRDYMYSLLWGNCFRSYEDAKKAIVAVKKAFADLYEDSKPEQPAMPTPDPLADAINNLADAIRRPKGAAGWGSSPQACNRVTSA